ncbi:MAG: hypothetical protein H0U22_06440 [Geodermatophilaceae bacterium]|nr:hypothetical protein [Geodermatophilaceae bacterium]
MGVQLERLTRVKYDGRKSKVGQLVSYLLDTAGILVADLDVIAVSYPSVDLPSRLHVGGLDLGASNVLHVGHHLAHAYSAFGPSGFSDSAVLVVDGHGDPYFEDSEDMMRWGPDVRQRLAERSAAADNTCMAPRFETESIYRFTRDEPPILLHRGYLAFGRRTGYTPLLFDPLGIGQNYRQVAAWLFGTGKSAGKVMGLAPYATEPLPLPPSFVSSVDRHPTLTDEWKAEIRSALAADPTLIRDHGWAAALAGYIQSATEQLMLDLAHRAVALSESTSLCMAGGVALNATTNGRIERELHLTGFYVQPASSDAGLSVGAASAACHKTTGRTPAWQPAHDAWGRRYSADEVSLAVNRHPDVQRLAPGDIAAVAEHLAAGDVVGWFEAGSELGPRALGHRSILADPRPAGMRDRLNLEIKHREWFRPFAPAVLEEFIDDWFEPGGAGRFMLSTTQVLPHRRAHVPAITHVDGSSRVQVLRRGEGEFRRLVEAFYKLTGIPMVLNTSFNVAGEPIVESPQDALKAFQAMKLDLLVLDGLLLGRVAPNRR